MASRSRSWFLPAASQETGVGLIEVMVSLVIIAIGLLGLAALQGKAQKAEMESYQRSQALILLHDMVSRLRANRAQQGSYLTSTADCSDTSTRAGNDLCEWSILLSGASETIGTNAVGAMIGGRGCITRNGNVYSITIAWQGLTESSYSSSDPRGTNTCGQGLYGNDALRRIVSVPVLFFDENSAL